MISITSAHNAVPSCATAKDTSGAPPHWARTRKGPPAWLKAVTPQGNPPKGTLDLSHSCIDHRHASQIGQPGSLHTSTAKTPNTAGKLASSSASTTHGTGPTSPLIHGSSGR